MAVRLDASTDMLSRTTNLPTITSFTVMAWVYISVDTNNYQQMIVVGAATGGLIYQLGTYIDGTTLNVYNGAADTQGSALSLTTWYHVAMTVAGTGANQQLAYLNGVSNITATAQTGVTAGKLWIGNSSFSEFLNGRMAAVKIYDAALTANEIAQEMRQILPVRTQNLNGFYPLLTTGDQTIDYSGSANTLTLGGTLATEDGPPIPWSTGVRRIYIPAATSPSSMVAAWMALTASGVYTGRMIV